MNTKHKILSLLLVLLMAATMLPVSAAESADAEAVDFFSAAESAALTAEELTSLDEQPAVETDSKPLNGDGESESGPDFSALESNAVAALVVGESVTGFSALDEAFAAVTSTEDVVYLLADAAGEYTLDAACAFTLDLNGFALDGTLDCLTSLVLADSSESGTGCVRAPEGSSWAVCCHEAFALVGGTVEFVSATPAEEGAAALYVADGTAVLRGGAVTSAGMLFALSQEETASVRVEGGCLFAEGGPVAEADASRVRLTGGVYNLAVEPGDDCVLCPNTDASTSSLYPYRVVEGPFFYGANVSCREGLVIKYYVLVPAAMAAEPEQYGVRFDDGELLPLSAAESATVGGCECLCFSLALVPKDMATAVKVSLEGIDGTVYAQREDYSAATYFENILARESSSDALRELACAALNYGAAAQTYFAYNTAAPANLNLSAERQQIPTVTPDQSWRAQYDAEALSACGFSQPQLQLVLGSRVGLRLYLLPLEAADTELCSAEVNGESLPLAFDEDTGLCYVTLDASLFPRLDSLCTVTVSNGSVSAELTLGVCSFLYVNLDGGDALADLCCALAVFRQAAERYYGL